MALSHVNIWDWDFGEQMRREIPFITTIIHPIVLLFLDDGSRSRLCIHKRREGPQIYFASAWLLSICLIKLLLSFPISTYLEFQRVFSFTEELQETHTDKDSSKKV